MTSRLRNAWRAAFGASVLAVGTGDAVVLGLTKAYFGSGYNSYALHSLGERAAFFAAAALIDVGFLAVLWLGALALSRLLRARPLVTVGLVTLFGLAIPLAFDVAMNRLHRVLGDVLELRLMLDLAGGSWSAALAEASQDLPPTALLLAAFFGAVAALWSIARRAERLIPALREITRPSARALGLLAMLGIAGGGTLLVASSTAAPAIHFGLEQKPAGRIAAWLAGELSDFDRDGVGLVSRPRDPAPFDAAIHPWAIEIPGNGIDENGFAADLPAGSSSSAPEYPRLKRASGPRRSFVLVLLESFRADVVGLRVDGREVTPNLNRLAREGEASDGAYAHTPMTWASRAQLLQGRVVPGADGSTLVEDFADLGYEVAWFSGQHDGFGAGDLRTGASAASPFYDARQDVSRRTSRSAQPISLQVSWKTVIERVDAYLASRDDQERALFLYVNLVDTHFPYWHAELDDLLGVGALPRGRIRPENRAEVWAAYLNAAANVDLAVGRLLLSAQRALGSDVAVLVTADHGQSFYEDGLLGHGQSLGEAQTRVPLLSRGVTDSWPALVGLAEVRGAIRASFGTRQQPTPRSGDGLVLQILGDLNRPTAIGLRDRAGVTVSVLAAGRVDRLGADGSRERLAGGAGDPAIRAWEALRSAPTH